MRETSPAARQSTALRRRRLRTVRSILGAVAILALYACGGDDGSESGGSEGAAAPSITILDFSFGDPITVAADTAVRVENADGVGHTWTSQNELFASGFLEPGDAFEFVFEQAGDFSFFCEIHPSMTGSITVTS